MHGDLHAGNVALRDGRFATFDWTDASVAHPFFDLVTFARPPRDLPGGDALAARITAAYLALWEDYESPERLRDAWRLARIAGSLHQTVSYRSILAGLEDAARWEHADGLRRFTADSLDQLDESIA
jgi:aminoglycoside phosphotransferase (APT) family kinase protein